MEGQEEPDGEEVVVTADGTGRPAPRQAPPMVIESAGGGRAVLVFSGELEAHAVGPLEERLGDPRLRDAAEWELRMHDLTRLDLPCAYALLRAATVRDTPAVVRVRGAHRAVRRSLREAGLETVATFED
ncbi:STAS domain-containing protein [Streptomyces sp. enrichment culture]|uniref:STAS domain-containing protein n=1 Tax=Streptomyces sp. enrichment culture TaxID=1795815 RepID=UPI003F575B42